MNKIMKGTVTAMATTGILLGTSSQCMAVAQAPTTPVASVSWEEEESARIALLPNQILRQEETKEESVQAFAMVNAAKTKIADLSEKRNERVQAEKIQEERLEKKRQAQKKARQEAKRRKEIQACCGVAAGSKDRIILERIVEAEAGNQNLKGRILVANVILNRVKHKAFPDTVEKVVFAHKGSRYQFSPIADGRYYGITVSNTTRKAVRAALYGTDPSQGALYFMERSSADRSNVRWFDRALTRLFTYGCHEFYK